MADANVYGYVNGKPCYSAEEFKYTKRGFEEIKTDDELLKFAEKVTGHWTQSGHNVPFASFYLSDYAMSEPFASLTRKEFERLKTLQEQEQARIEEINAKYKWSNYEGRQLTESEVRLFLDRKVDLEIERWHDPNNFWVKQVEEYHDKAISDFRNGKVIKVDYEEYNAAYGNGTGAFARALFSDGHVEDSCYGYLD